MHRFFCPSQNISDDKITLNDKSQLHHLRDVLRLKIKDPVIIFDNKGNEYSCIIEKLLPKTIIFKIKNKYKFTPSKLTQELTIACAIPKNFRMDEIIDKLTQLGVDRIIPLQTQRVVIKLNDEKKNSKILRWQKIALNASQQCSRNSIPIIDSIKDLKEVLSESGDFDLKLIPTLIGKRKSPKEIFVSSHPKNILVLIGPEGDFTPQELELAKNSGFIPISLGNLVLRVETAAIAIVSFIRLYGNS